jgi:hypothetical protein
MLHRNPRYREGEFYHAVLLVVVRGPVESSKQVSSNTPHVIASSHVRFASHFTLRLETFPGRLVSLILCEASVVCHYFFSRARTTTTNLCPTL